jgi:hypothetical protein
MAAVSHEIAVLPFERRKPARTFRVELFLRFRCTRARVTVSLPIGACRLLDAKIRALPVVT